ncbi:MAG TPA: hypothetical protein VN177_08135, partial [Myxococcales bacterium]|nr:hypothetical protein [Myxococcales bacterium]
MLGIAASLGLLLGAGEALRWNAAAEVQARGRDEPGGTAAGRSGLAELDLHGQLGLSPQWPDGAATLIWSPSLLLRQAVSGAPETTGNGTRQLGRAEIRARLAPATRLISRTSV